MTYSTLTLKSISSKTDLIYRLIFESTSIFDFSPGQRILLCINDRWMPYVVAERINEKSFCIYIKIIEKGEASRVLVSMQAGDTLIFRFDETHARIHLDGPAVCIGLGIGVVPVYSLVESTLGESENAAIHFLYSARSDSELIYRNKLKALRDDYVSLNLEIVDERTRSIRDTRMHIIDLAKTYPDRMFIIGAQYEVAHDITDLLKRHGVHESLIKIA